MNRKNIILLVLSLVAATTLNACGNPSADVSEEHSGQEDTEMVSDNASLDEDGSQREEEGTDSKAKRGQAGLRDMSGKGGSQEHGDETGTGEDTDKGGENSESNTDKTAMGDTGSVSAAQGGAEGSDYDEQEMTQEEWMEYIEQFLPTASHKPEHIQPIIDALDMLPQEKPESVLQQRDVDCDTLQWFNGTYAMFLESSGTDYHFIGGYDDQSSSNVDYIQNQLESSWGITDRASSIDTLYWLALSGHASGYAEDIQMMALYGFLDLSEEELRKAVFDRVDGESLTEEDAVRVTEYFLREKAVYDACGENGMDAWDYCRFMQIAGNCYYAGYLTLEESLTVQLEAARAIQQQFSSWDEMNQSYLQGYIFWVDNSTATYIRQRAYERLQNTEDSPFRRLDFKMSLEKFW